MSKLLKQLSVVFVVLCLTAVSVDSQIMIDVGDTSSLVWTGKVKKQSRHNQWQGSYKSGEVAVTCTYNLGRLNGSWTKFNRDGKKYVSGNYVNGKRHGMWVQFHSTGDTHLVVHYNAGELHGPYKSYTSQRKPIMHGEYTHGRKQGVWVSYNPMSAETVETTYSNDSIIKPIITKYKNQVIRSQEGRSETKWSGGGELEFRRIVIDSEHLRHESFWPNGAKRDSGTVENAGLRVGLWVTRNEQGKIIERKWYVPSSTLLQFPRKDFRDGLDSSHQYSDSGLLIRREIFTRKTSPVGAIPSKVYNYDKITGRLISIEHRESGFHAGPTITYYPNGKIESSLHIIGIRYNGSCIWYYPSGVVLGTDTVVQSRFSDNARFYTQKGVALKKTAPRYKQIRDSLGVKYSISKPESEEEPFVFTDDMEIPPEFVYGEDDGVVDLGNPPTPNSPGGDVLQEVQEEALTFAHEMPYFPGGEEAMKKYIAANIIYPQEEKAAKVTGTVLIYLEVARDGTVKNVQTKKGVNGHPNFSKEAERVVKSMPKWVPGKMNGRPVTVAVTIPVNFTL